MECDQELKRVLNDFLRHFDERKSSNIASFRVDRRDQSFANETNRLHRVRTEELNNTKFVPDKLYQKSFWSFSALMLPKRSRQNPSWIFETYKIFYDHLKVCKNPEFVIQSCWFLMHWVNVNDRFSDIARLRFERGNANSVGARVFRTMVNMALAFSSHSSLFHPFLRGFIDLSLIHI